MSIKSKIRNWLDITEPRDFTDEFSGLRDEIKSDIWKMRQVVEKVTEVTCTKCGEKFLLWPFGGDYYIEKDHTYRHRICPNKMKESSNE